MFSNMRYNVEPLVPHETVGGHPRGPLEGPVLKCQILHLDIQVEFRTQNRDLGHIRASTSSDISKLNGELRGDTAQSINILS